MEVITNTGFTVLAKESVYTGLDTQECGQDN